MEETLRILVSIGFAMLLVLLRFDSERFGVAEHLVVVPHVPPVVARRRIAWYGLAIAIAASIVLVHPDPRGALGLDPGELGPTLLLGLLAAAFGVLQAAAVGYLRHDRLRTTFGRGAEWTIANGLATSLVDEVAFRGAVLGFLLLTGAGPLVAVLGETFLYALATRTTVAGVDRYLLALALGIGFVGGIVTLASGGVGAAFIGHAATRLAVALFLGARGDEVDLGGRGPARGLGHGRGHGRPKARADGRPEARGDGEEDFEPARVGS
ncbi:MAG TPA: CPBP family glutamic-type intramembrane protease [Candidatus Limnocylindrales bacterium]